MATSNEHCSWTNEIFRVAGLHKYPHVRCEIAFVCQCYKEDDGTILWNWIELGYTEYGFNKHVLHENEIKNNMLIYLWNHKSKPQHGKFYGFCWEPITLSILLPVRCNTHRSSVIESNLRYKEYGFNKHVLHGNEIKNNMLIYLLNHKSKPQHGKFYGFCWEPITLSILLLVRCNTHSSTVTVTVWRL